MRGLAPWRSLVGGVVSADFPEALRAAAQTVALVDDLRRLIRRHLAADPQVALIGIKLLARAGNEELIRRLPLAAEFRLIGFENPAQPRLHDVDAERIDLVLAAQVRRPKQRRFRRGGG